MRYCYVWLRHLLGFVALLACVSLWAAPSYEYALQDRAGKTWTNKSFPDKYQLIAFGFTHCPDVCPTTLYDFRQVLAGLAQPDQVQAIFISIDPLRDQAEGLAQYVAYFDPRILALRGSREATDAAVEAFRATYGYQWEGKKVAAEDLDPSKPYEVFHSTLIYLLDKEGHLLDVFDYQSGAKALLEGVEAALSSDTAKG